jgi:GAF domain-containing protein
VTDRDQAFAFAIDTALGLVPSQAGVLLLYDYQARDLYSAVIRAPGGAQIPGYRTMIGEGMAGFCATQGLPLALSQGDQDARFSTVLGTHCGLDVYTLAGVPIQYQGRLFGVLELANRQAGGSYTTDELNALAYIGRQLAERLSTTLSTQTPTIQDPGVEPTPS